MSEESPPGNQLMEEAALWFARMRGPEAEDHRASFEAWLARGALHRGAYNRAGEIFSMGKFLADEPREDDPEEEQAQEPGVRRLRLWQPALLLAVSVIVLFAWAILARPPGAMFGSADEMATTNGRVQRTVEFATGRDDVRSERLADGSTVTLAPLSLLTVSYESEQRTFRLERGSVRFEVAHEARPFVVFAGNGSVTARGTVFEVTIRRDAKVEVKLVRGSVEVAIPPAPTSPPQKRRLTPGQSLIFALPVQPSRGMVAPPVLSPQDASPGQAQAGESGNALREFDGVRVAELIAEANASARVPIRLADSRIESRRISGRFRVTDTGQLAERLAGIFDLVIDRSNPAEIVLEAKAKP